MSDVVGVDLGGTKVAAALLNGGRLGDSAIEPTNRSSATALLDQVVALVARVRCRRPLPGKHAHCAERP